MLETIREFALEQLAARDDLAPTQAAHTAAMIDLARRADAGLGDPEQGKAWAERLKADHDNLRVALGLALDTERLEAAADLGQALWWFWYLRGHWREGRDWLEQIIERIGDATDIAPAIHADLYKGTATLAKEQGLYTIAKVRYEQALAIYRASGDERGLATTLNNLGGLYHRQGQLAEARAAYIACLEHFRASGGTASVALVLDNLAIISQEHGLYDEALTYHEESLAIWRTLEDTRGLGNKLTSLGEFHLFQRAFDSAINDYAEALALSLVNDDKRARMSTLNGLGLAHYWQADLTASLRASRESLLLAQELGEQFFVALCLVSCAHVLGVRGMLEAAQLYGAAERLREAIQTPITPAYRPLYDEAVARSAAHHQQRLWAAAWSRGRSLPIAQAIELALSDSASLRTGSA